jgi:NADH dehydrogenase FAD-containing subunit
MVVVEKEMGKMSEATVVVVGGGYAGITAAKALDEVAQVVLVEPKDAFQHNVAALRALVDRSWTAQTFLPYDRLLSRGTVVHDRAVEVDQHGVQLASGQRLTADYLVLATGSTYPFPAKSEHLATADAVAHYHQTYENLAQARRVLLVGAGAVGLELAGEIATVWPDKQITLVDLAEQILPGPYDDKLRDEISRQLDELSVTRLLGSPLSQAPDTEAGELKSFTATTARGQQIEADIWFRCYGIAPVTSYLAGDLARARTADGYLEVTPELNVVGFDTVFAVGDIAAIDTNKAGLAARQGETAAHNIKARIEGSAERTAYTVAPPMIILPLGPRGGAGQRADTGEIVPPEFVSQVKGGDMFINRYRQLLNRPEAES